MRPFAVLYILGWVFAAISVAMLLPAAFAIALDSIPLVQAFLVPSVAVGFMSGSMIIAFRGREAFTGRRASLLLLALVWLLIPAASALPFYTSGHPGSAVQSYFEAVSGFTTTGATILDDLSEVPSSILIWRSLLQWIGGLVTLVSLATLLGPLSGSIMQDRQLRLVGHSAQGTGVHMREALATITPLYSALTAACFVALSVTGIPAFDAFCLSLSSLSTGGFMPRNGTILLYGSPLAELVLAFFMIIGAISIIWIRAIFQMRWPIVRDIHEPVWMFWCVLVLGLALAISLMVKTSEASFSTLVHTVTLGIATAASILSTTGLAISDQTMVFIPYIALMCMCIVGGGRFSTAGGLKLYRVFGLMRQLGRELRLLVFPHGVRPSRHGAEALDIEIVKATWITLTAFVFAIGVVGLIVAWDGVPFSGALLAAVSTISNIGPAYELSRIHEFPEAPTYAEMAPIAQLALCAGMIFGRVEILAMLSLFQLIFWRD